MDDSAHAHKNRIRKACHVLHFSRTETGAVTHVPRGPSVSNVIHFPRRPPLIPGLPAALKNYKEPRYEVVPISDSLGRTLLRKLRDAIGFMGVRFRRWTWFERR